MPCCYHIDSGNSFTLGGLQYRLLVLHRIEALADHDLSVTEDVEGEV